MQFDFRQLAPRDCYKLLVSVVVPRPIALVTSLSPEGHLNAAPFSFFNVMGGDPPVVVLGVGDRSAGEAKDTAHNIRSAGEFVINIVDEAMAEAMNICAIDFPPDVDELVAAGLSTASSIQVRTPHIAESPVNLECREISTIEIGRNRIILGEVLHLHIRDDLIDPANLHVRTENIGAIARLHGAGWYARTTDLFQMPRLTYEEWQQKNS
jgi:flavin reductase (DIM6/NTAB) family NADH-FMN oxidoreductase RutF